MSLCSHASFSNFCFVNYVVTRANCFSHKRPRVLFMSAIYPYHPHLAPRESPRFILEPKPLSCPLQLPLSNARGPADTRHYILLLCTWRSHVISYACLHYLSVCICLYCEQHCNIVFYMFQCLVFVVQLWEGARFLVRVWQCCPSLWGIQGGSFGENQGVF